MNYEMRHHFITLLCIASLIFQFGCATNFRRSSPVVPDDNGAETGVIGVVTVHFEPQVGLDNIGPGKGTGALQGAGKGALNGAKSFAGDLGGCSGQQCGYEALARLTLMAAGAAVGAIVGAVSGALETANRAQDMQAQAQTAIMQFRIQENLSKSVADYARDEAAISVVQIADAGPASPEEQPDYQAMSGGKVDKVLEVAILSIGAEGGGFLDTDPYLSLIIRARARLVSLNDSKAVAVLDYQYISRDYKVSEWSADNFQRLSDELAVGYQEIAEQVVDEMFLLYYPQRAQPVTEVEAEASQAIVKPETLEDKKESPNFPLYVLGAKYPEVRRCSSCGPMFASKANSGYGNVEFVTINGLQPTLRWEAFPRPHDLNTRETQHQITDVTYELKIYTAVPAGIFLIPERQIYARRGLPTPYHQLEQPLEPCAEYFWTVRARFKLDSRYRATEWGGTYPEGTDPWEVRQRGQGLKFLPIYFKPSWMYYPFKTPPAQLDAQCPG